MPFCEQDTQQIPNNAENTQPARRCRVFQPVVQTQNMRFYTGRSWNAIFSPEVFYTASPPRLRAHGVECEFLYITSILSLPGACLVSLANGRRVHLQSVNTITVRQESGSCDVATRRNLVRPTKSHQKENSSCRVRVGRRNRFIDLPASNINSFKATLFANWETNFLSTSHLPLYSITPWLMAALTSNTTLIIGRRLPNIDGKKDWRYCAIRARRVYELCAWLPDSSNFRPAHVRQFFQAHNPASKFSQLSNATKMPLNPLFSDPIHKAR